MTSELRYMDVDLGTGAILRVGLVTGPDASEGGDLILAAGFPDRVGWPRLLAESINVPASALPDLRAALEALGGQP